MVAQSPDAVRADIRGRQLGLIVSLGIPAVALSAVMIALTGRRPTACGGRMSGP